MKKQIAAATAAFVCLMVLATGCGGVSADDNWYDYDLSEYVELGQYKGIPVMKSGYGIKDSDVEMEIVYELDAAGEYEELTEGSVEEWDIANIDFMGMKDGEPFEGGTDEGFDLIIGSGQFIPGFEEQLIGEAIGDTVTIGVTFPEDYYQAPDLLGQDVEFIVTVNSVRRVNLTQEYIELNTPFGSPKEYRDAVRSDLELNVESEAQSMRMETLWGTLMDTSNILDHPSKEVKAFVNDFGKQQREQATSMGKTWKDYLSQDMGMTQKEFDEMVQEQAKEMVGMEMIIYAIARDEGLELTEEEYEKGKQVYLDNMGFSSDEEFKETAGQYFEEYAGKKNIVLNLLYERVMELMDKNAIEIES
ncbi:MAG: trigger factor [Clostridiales bacterium]|nr:trigger factor [Clostridiales bacterium]